MTGEGILQQDLVVSKLLRQDIDRYQEYIPSCLRFHSIKRYNNSNGSSGRYPTTYDTIQYIHLLLTNSQHNNPLCRAVPIENIHEEVKLLLSIIMTEKYQRNNTHIAETVIGFFGFDRTVYSNYKKKGRK